MKLEYPDPILGSIEIDIGDIQEENLNPEHVKNEVKASK